MPSSTTKRCPRCKKKKPRSLKYWHKRSERYSGLSSICKQCYKEEREKLRRDPEWVKSQFWLRVYRVYGITKETYYRLWAEQRGKCPACGGNLQPPRSLRGLAGYHQHTNLATKTACIHHDKKTKRVLGLWCWKCNVGCGHFNDDPALLRRAAAAQEKA